jgi:hypothetical protein
MIQNTNNIHKEVDVIIETAVEEAYFTGQRDALEGKVRINKINDSTWVWVERPLKRIKE